MNKNTLLLSLLFVLEIFNTKHVSLLWNIFDIIFHERGKITLLNLLQNCGAYAFHDSLFCVGIMVLSKCKFFKITCFKCKETKKNSDFDTMIVIKIQEGMEM